MIAIASKLKHVTDISGVIIDNATGALAGYATTIIQATLNANFKIPAFAPQSDIWVHFSKGNTWSVMVTAERNVVKLFGASDICRVTTTAVNNELQAQRWDGAAWVNFGSPFVPTFFNTRQDVDVHYKRAVSGHIRVYLGSTLVAEYTGDTSAMAECTQVMFQGSTIQAGTHSRFSEIMIDTLPTIGARLVEVAATAAGDVSNWSGGFADIGATSGDSSFVSTETAGNQVLFNMADLPVGVADLFPRLVQIDVRARRNSTGPGNIDVLTKSGGTVSAEPLATLDYGFINQRVQFGVNPATSAPWTVAEIDALQFGFEAKA